MFYDVTYSADEGFWWVDVYNRKGVSQESPDNEFTSSDVAIVFMAKNFPTYGLMKVIN